MKPSKRFDWNSADTKKFLEETLKVLAPYLLVIIPVLIGQLPQEAGWTSVAIFLLQRARSMVEIYLAGKK